LKNFQNKLRLMVKKILRKYGYPPDKQEKATITVLEQAKLLGYGWVN
jgi:type I restriction enzyme R subunit